MVDNLDKAIANFRDNYGVKEWQVMSMPEGAPMRALALDCAQNKTMIEPIPGHDRNYKDWVPESDTAARFHHLGFLIDSADEYRQIADQFNTLDFRAALAGTNGDLHDYHYADTVSHLDHNCELIHLLPGGKNFFSMVPNNVPA